MRVKKGQCLEYSMAFYNGRWFANLFWIFALLLQSAKILFNVALAILILCTD